MTYTCIAKCYAKDMLFYRLPSAKRAHLLLCYIQDLTAVDASKAVGVNRNTANEWYHRFQGLVSEHTRAMQISVDPVGLKLYMKSREAKYRGLRLKAKATQHKESKLRYYLGGKFAAVAMEACSKDLQG